MAPGVRGHKNITVTECVMQYADVTAAVSCCETVGHGLLGEEGKIQHVTFY